MKPRDLLLVPCSILATLASVEGFFTLNRQLSFLPPFRVLEHPHQPVGLDPRLARILAKIATPGTRDHRTEAEVPDDGAYEHLETRPLPPGEVPAGAARSLLVTLPRRDSGRPIYRAHYSWDSRGRRLTRDPSSGRPGRQPLVFRGCSFTCGEGVDDFDT